MSKIMILLKNAFRHEESNGVKWLLDTPYINY